jgi:4-amino-4-deoxy-L-arabinose transferase-like glycosyltransferase
MTATPLTLPAKRSFESVLTRMRPGTLLFAWLVIRTVVWTVGIATTHPNAQIDMTEWGSWGSTFAWGYPKHPPLPGWIAGLALRLTPGQVWGEYLAGYLCSAGCLWVAWMLAREFLPARSAVFAALALDALAYLTNDPADFSNNVVLNLLWAMTTLALFRAIRSGRTRTWLVVGFLTGASFLTKYSIGLLFIPIGVYVLTDRVARRCLVTPGPYLAGIIAAVIVTPHLLWVVRNDFITFTYAAERSADLPGPWAHVKNPAAFLAGQVAILIPVAFLLWPVLGRYKPAADVPVRQFLHAAVLGPVAILLVLSAATGCQLRLVWASPLWTLAGVWLLANFPGDVTAAAAKAVLLRWAALTVAIFAFATGFQRIEPYLTGKAGRTLFPGKALTDVVTETFAARYGRPVPIAAGEPWRAGLVCCYAPNHPVLYSSGAMDYLVMDPKHTPWTGDADLNTRGGVILWDPNMTPGEVLDLLRERFPRLEIQAELELPYQTSAPVSVARTGWAIVPPADQ